MIATRFFILSFIVILAGCATKQTDIEDVSQLPPTAASGETELSAHIWSGVGGKPVRNLTLNSNYPDNPTSVERVNAIDFPDPRGDKYGQRISGVLVVPESGDYELWISADESAELWLSSDHTPFSKRLIAYTNKPTGYKDWTTYSTQKSGPLRLEAGQQYFLEVLHKEYTRSDYLNVSWKGPGFELTTLTDANLRPMAEAETVSGETAYRQGYHYGYTAGSYLDAFNDQYPPLDDDGDGLPNFYELLIGSNPQDITDAYLDSDGDQLTAYEEFQILTNPQSSDSDSDGIPDGFEFVYGMNALDAADASLDLDDDGISNYDEYIAGTAPDDQSDFPAPPEPEPEPVPLTRLVALNWDKPTQREDGSSLATSEIQAYIVYAGSNPDSMASVEQINDADQLTVDRELGVGTYYFAISTLTTDGQEGAKSGVLTIDVLSDGQVSSSYEPASEPSGGGEGQIVDTDGDGMSDEYELLYGFDINDPSDALLDSDQDGISNVDEFLAGSDPLVSPVIEPQYFPVTLSWQIPTSREDGSGLQLSDIASYKIYSGTSESSLTLRTQINDPQLINWTDDFLPGSYFFALSTVTKDSAESKRSGILQLNIADDGSFTSSYDDTHDPSGGQIVDSDGDGMSDEYELLYGFDINDPSDALLDSDQDGISNIDEYLAGTDPVESVATAPTSVAVTLSWDIPTTREDGTALQLNEIGAYNIYSGTSQSSLSSVATISDPSQLSWSEDFSAGTYYFAISTTTLNGVEGQQSETLSVVVP